MSWIFTSRCSSSTGSDTCGRSTPPSAGPQSSTVLQGKPGAVGKEVSTRAWNGAARRVYASAAAPEELRHGANASAQGLQGLPVERNDSFDACPGMEYRSCLQTSLLVCPCCVCFASFIARRPGSYGAEVDDVPCAAGIIIRQQASSSDSLHRRSRNGLKKQSHTPQAILYAFLPPGCRAYNRWRPGPVDFLVA
eukprot:scaffold290_cov367-Pinguiococcus_pyrenoidosus.AAC.5